MSFQSSMLHVGGTTHSAAGEKVYDHAKRAASPAGSASQGPPNTPAAEDEAAEAQNDLLSSLSKLAVPARDSQKCSESSDASSLRALPVSTDQHCPIPDLLGQQQKRTEVITAAAATEETPSNKRDSTKSFLTMSSVFDSASEDTAITADEESQNAAFSQAISMDDMEDWVRLDI
ncbi:hypothetical protein ARSEF1564_005237 [Beauveria bassiana]